MTNLGRLLRLHRNIDSRTQQQLANDIHISLSEYKRIEYDTNKLNAAVVLKIMIWLMKEY